jgi:hypothetical protein
MILQCNKRNKYQSITTFLLIFITYETLLIVYPTKVRDWFNNLLLYHNHLYEQLYGYATISQYISQPLLSYKDVKILVLVIFSIKGKGLQLILKII